MLSEIDETGKKKKLSPNKAKEVNNDLNVIEKEMHELYDSDKEDPEPVDFMGDPEEEEKEALRPGEEMIALESDIRHKLRVKEDRKERKKSRMGTSGDDGRGESTGSGWQGQEEERRQGGGQRREDH